MPVGINLRRILSLSIFVISTAAEMSILDFMYNPLNFTNIPLPHVDIPAPPNPSEEVSVENSSSSSILFKWNIPEGCIKEANYDIEVQYRPFLIRSGSGSLEWGPNGTYVTAVRNPARYQWSSRVYDSNFLIKHKDGVLIEVNELPHANVTYEFVISILLYDRLCTTKVRAETKITAPLHPPRTCTGCFHVFDSGDKQRSVRIYWPEAFEQYHLRVFEDDQMLPYYSGRNDLEWGYSQYTISLKRHKFTFSSVNKVGSSRNASIVEVPSQDDVLPPIASSMCCENDSCLLSWQVPDDLNVMGFTVCWIYKYDKHEAPYRITDFVYVSKHRTRLLVKTNEFVGLAISVNTDTSSSGLYVARVVRK